MASEPLVDIVVDGDAAVLKSGMIAPKTELTEDGRYAEPSLLDRMRE